MKYFLDTEFIEGFHKPLMGKRRHFIDLISIGIVSDDGREYYAISNEFDPKKADKWVLENVLDPMVHEWVMSYNGDGRNRVLDMIEGKGQIGAIKIMQREAGKSNAQIAEGIYQFTQEEKIKVEGGPTTFWQSAESERIIRQGYTEPEFYAYYADYDWVVFCSLFGRMIDLPKGFPMYCIDLKQTMDEKAIELTDSTKRTQHHHHPEPLTHDTKLKILKSVIGFPVQKNEHSAIDDARWNKKLYEFLQTI